MTHYFRNKNKNSLKNSLLNHIDMSREAKRTEHNRRYDNNNNTNNHNKENRVLLYIQKKRYDSLIQHSTMLQF